MVGLFSVTTSRQHELIMRNPGRCDELRIRDILDDVAVMTSGAFVAGYELGGLHSHYHTDEMRNRAKESLEAVLRSMPDRRQRVLHTITRMNGARGMLRRSHRSDSSSAHCRAWPKRTRGRSTCLRCTPPICYPSKRPGGERRSLRASCSKLANANWSRFRRSIRV